jgi:hypothetical protein
MARPTINDSSMTPAERMRRHRERKRIRGPEPNTINDVLRLMTRQQQAKYIRRSVRYWHYVVAFRRCTLIDWDGEVLNGKHGRIGIAFVAEVCRYGNADAQQAVHDRIKEAGAAAGRALWREMVQAAHDDGTLSGYRPAMRDLIERGGGVHAVDTLA